MEGGGGFGRMFVLEFGRSKRGKPILDLRDK